MSLRFFFTGLWAATQFVAWRVAYHPSLGPNLHGVYPPWDILVWWRQGGYDAFPDLFLAGGSAGTGITAVMLIFSLLNRQLLQTQVELWKRYTVQHVGRAEKTLKKLDFLKMKVCSSEAGKIRKQERVIIFVLRETFIFWPFAPTRSGKGVCLVLPTLLTWMESCVVTDIKGELWALTAGWRQKYAKQRTLRFDPASPYGSIKWNPLDEVRLGTEFETGDVQNLAGTLVDPTGKGLEDTGSSAHFNKLARSLLVGIIIHALYKREKTGEIASLDEIDIILQGKVQDDSYWEGLKNTNI